MTGFRKPGELVQPKERNPKIIVIEVNANDAKEMTISADSSQQKEEILEIECALKVTKYQQAFEKMRNLIRKIVTLLLRKQHLTRSFHSTQGDVMFSCGIWYIA